MCVVAVVLWLVYFEIECFVLLVLNECKDVDVWCVWVVMMGGGVMCEVIVVGL